MKQPEYHLNHPPVFIVGPLRSGSTLIRLLLDHHSQLNIFGEFEGSVCQAREDNWPNIEDYRLFVKHDRQTSALNLDIDESLQYEPLVQSFLWQMQQRSAKPLVGACVHSRMDLLPKLWPDARYIHILRDPRDVARSAIGMGWVRNVHEGTKYWLGPENHWDRLCSLVPPQQRIEVRYEELVEDPQQHLTNICTFLGLEYEPGMLNIENDTTYSYPDPSYSYQWKKKLSNREINWVEYQCKDLLLSRGYQLSGNRISRPSQIEKLYIKAHNRLGRSVANMKRWGVILWLQHFLSKTLGPKSWQLAVQKKIDRIVIERLK